MHSGSARASFSRGSSFGSRRKKQPSSLAPAQLQLSRQALANANDQVLRQGIGRAYEREPAASSGCICDASGQLIAVCQPYLFCGGTAGLGPKNRKGEPISHLSRRFPGFTAFGGNEWPIPVSAACSGYSTCSVRTSNMKRFSILALLIAVGIVITSTVVFSGSSEAVQSKSSRGCVDCKCPDCNGETCTCEVCECGACGCKTADATPRSCCSMKLTAKDAAGCCASKTAKPECGREVCKCTGCDGETCTCEICECVNCGCAK